MRKRRMKAAQSFLRHPERVLWDEWRLWNRAVEGANLKGAPRGISLGSSMDEESRL